MVAICFSWRRHIVVSLYYSSIKNNFWHRFKLKGIEVFFFGILFVPTFFHLIFEAHRQKRIVRQNHSHETERF